jgi:hypothetical protein
MSVIALGLLGLGSVTVAMVTLGSTEPDYTPAPAASVAASTPPTLEPSPTDAPLPSDAPSPVMTVTLPRTPPEVLTVVTQAHASDKVWSLVWRYPQVKGTPLAATVNADIVDEVQTRIGSFEGGPAAVQQLPGKVNTLTGSFSANMVSPELLSLTLRWVDDTSPAHDATSISTMNYDLAGGQRISLLDLFTDQEGALTIISAESRTQLIKLLGSDYDPTVAEPGSAALPTNFANWALTPAGLRITFDEYQVGTFADGMPTVVIPWAKLQNVMIPVGAVARLAGFPPDATYSPLPTATPSPSATDTPIDLPSDFPSPSAG